MKKMIYFDNASTSFPKAPGLGSAVADFIENSGLNINRGIHLADTNELVYDTRKLIADLFDCDDPNSVIFTSGDTMSINMLIGGLLKKGDHVVVSSMEHHALMRPLVIKGIKYTVVQADKNGTVKPDDFENAICDNTKLIIVTHASNVCGTVLPIKEIGETAKRHNIFFAVDCAQTAGVMDISQKCMNIDFIAFAGHKGLMGPQGIGGFVVSKELAQNLRPYIAGGTGSYSDLYDMPPILPDRFEAGTINLPGIAGLNHSVKFVMNTGIDTIYEHERMLIQRFIKNISDLPVRIIGGMKNSVGVVSIVSPFSNNRILAERISEKGVALRYGLHCAPNAHKTLGTYKTGTIRFSVGYFNTVSEVDEVSEIISLLV